MDENQVVAPQAPVAQLKTNRGMLKFILLTAITLGIYGIVCMTKSTNDVNTICSRYDNKKSMHYCLLTFIVAPITCGIAGLVWNNNICARMGNELNRRGCSYQFGAGTFWGWGFFGSLLFGVGPLVFMHKFFKALNILAADYNVKG